MAGYEQTLLQGLMRQRAFEQQQRRLAEAQRQHEYQQRLGMQRQAQTERSAAARMEAENFRNRLAFEQFRNTMRHQLATEQQAREEAGLRRQDFERKEAADRERALAQRRGNLKPGYKWKGPDSVEQEPVPGGPAWRELSSKHADDLNRLGAFGEVSDAAIAAVNRILDPKKRSSGFNPNFGGYNAALLTQHMPSVVPGFGETQNVRNDLENLKSNLKAQGASLMRGVGGAPGSITEREWPILEKLIESLSPLQEEKTAEETLRRIAHRFEGMKLRSLSNYKQEWADSPFYKKDPFASVQVGNTPGTGTIPQGVDPRDWKFMTPEERALWQTPAQSQ